SCASSRPRDGGSRGRRSSPTAGTRPADLAAPRQRRRPFTLAGVRPPPLSHRRGPCTAEGVRVREVREVELGPPERGSPPARAAAHETPAPSHCTQKTFCIVSTMYLYGTPGRV